MKRLLLLIPLFLASCSLSVDKAQKEIVKQEREYVPLVIQAHPEIVSIKINNLKVVDDKEPMSGLLYTTWTYEGCARKKITKPFVVEVKNIKMHKGKLQWESDWDRTYQAMRQVRNSRWGVD